MTRAMMISINQHWACYVNRQQGCVRCRIDNAKKGVITTTANTLTARNKQLVTVRHTSRTFYDVISRYCAGQVLYTAGHFCVVYNNSPAITGGCKHSDVRRAYLSYRNLVHYTSKWNFCHRKWFYIISSSFKYAKMEQCINSYNTSREYAGQSGNRKLPSFPIRPKIYGCNATSGYNITRSCRHKIHNVYTLEGKQV